MDRKDGRVLLAVYFVTALVAVLVVCGSLYWHESAQIERRLRDREVVRAGMLAHYLSSGLQVTAHDLRLLATSDAVLNYLTSGDPAAREPAMRRVRFFSAQNPEYDQLRFLDTAGREMIRVDHGDIVAPADEIPVKSDQPYFQQAIGLAAGGMYVSAFGLHMENGRLEVPYQPVVQFATPLFDHDGQRQGVGVVRVPAEHLLRPLEEALRADAPRLRLLNADGYWLKAASPDLEWGFMIPGREAASLARSDPGEWMHLTREPEGQVRHQGGLLTWQRVAPRDFVGPSPGNIVTGDAFLIVASEISAVEWAAHFSALRTSWLIGTSGMAILAAIGARMFRGRQRARMALRRSEENLSVTLDSIGDAVLATDTAGRVTRMNPVAERLTGWSLRDARERPIAEIFRIVNEQSRQPAVIPVSEVLATGETRGLAHHTVLVARDGSERAIADSAAPIRDLAGRIIGVVLVFRDVTAQRRTETELVNLRTALDAHAIVSVTDARGRIIAVNDKFCALSQYSREELLGRDHRVVNSGHHPKEFMRDLWETISRGAVWHGEIRNRAKDGSIYWAKTTIVPFRDALGQPAQYIAIQADITARQRAQEELDRFFTLSLDFLCIASGDGYFKRVSPAVTDMLGWSQAEFLARPFLEFVHPDDHAATLQEVEKQLVAGERVLKFENRYRHKDGSWRILSWRSTPQPGGLMYATARDVTERNRAEEALRQAKAELEERVRERTAELARINAELEERVHQRTAELESANRELESFSYSVSHDLRAPLRHIHGYVEMLAAATTGQLPEKAQRYLATIAAASREMGQLIDDLLAFSRTSRAALQQEPFHLAGLVQETLDGLELMVKDRNISWQIAPLPAVRGDRSLVKQVLSNLIANAVKYSRQRDPARIEIGTAGDGDGRVTVFVRDNGAGFDMQYAHKLFGVFQRLHSTDEFEGTGIGLATVQRIIHRHGGRVWADALPDQGATFYFTLESATGACSPAPPPSTTNPT